MAIVSTLNEQLIQAWTIYISFFTVFLTVNMTALGVVATKMQLGMARTLIAVTFVAQNAIAVVTGLRMAWYTRDVARQFTQEGAAGLAYFGDLGVWGGYGNAIGNGIIGLMWVALVFVATRPRPGNQQRCD